MSATIDILTDGYANIIEKRNEHDQQTKKFMRATGSCCLVRSSGFNILFDTMGPWEKDQLVDKLARLKVHPDDIKYLVCSHNHPDHIGNANLFLRADKHFMGTSVYTGDEYDLNCFEPIGSYTYQLNKKAGDTSQDDATVEVIKYENYKLDKNLTLEPTPGHTLECISLIVNDCEKLGIVGLCGDLFERQEDLNDDSIWLGAGSQNPDLQRAHRSSIMRKCDFILPGHGPLFKVEKNY